MRISDWSSDVCSSDLFHAEARAAAGGGLDPDAAAEVADDLARYGEAEAGAARLVGQVGAGLLELLEDQLAVLRRHAAAIVGDRDLQTLRTRLRRHDHMAGPLVAELGRVRQQIGRAHV